MEVVDQSSSSRGRDQLSDQDTPLLATVLMWRELRSPWWERILRTSLMPTAMEGDERRAEREGR